MKPSILCLETFKRAQRGLYAGEHIRFGNTVSEMGNKSRRTWKPNVQRLPLWSETLKEKVKVRVSMTALKKIEQVGGLDTYLLNQRHAESLCAEELRHKILRRRLEEEIARDRNCTPGLFGPA